MILYTNSTTRTVSLTVPVTPSPGTIDVKVYKGADVVYEPATVTAVGNTYSFQLPFTFVTNDAHYKVNWNFNYVENTVSYVYDESTFVDVVTPYLSLDEVKTILGITNDTEAAAAEASARYIINSHCGQSFGRFKGVVTVTGKDGNYLALPNRLISINKFNGVDATDNFEISADGWFLAFYPWGVPPVKADYYGLHQHVGGVIHNPNNVKLGMFRNATYDIDGVWGYQNVPAPVSEAARILVRTYSDPDSEYRDRYLTSMTAADWRIQFNNDAFVNTGNARADQLLADYVSRRGWVVI